jgi:hypothetical protein
MLFNNNNEESNITSSFSSSSSSSYHRRRKEKKQLLSLNSSSNIDLLLFIDSIFDAVIEARTEREAGNFYFNLFLYKHALNAYV